MERLTQIHLATRLSVGSMPARQVVFFLIIALLVVAYIPRGLAQPVDRQATPIGYVSVTLAPHTRPHVIELQGFDPNSAPILSVLDSAKFRGRRRAGSTRPSCRLAARQFGWPDPDHHPVIGAGANCHRGPLDRRKASGSRSEIFGWSGAPDPTFSQGDADRPRRG